VTRICTIVLCIGLAACMNKKKDEEGKEPLSPPASAAPAAGSPGAAGSAATASAPVGTQSAEAAAAGTAGGGATTPTPEACATPTALRCETGQIDGCSGGLTSVHLCVAGDAKGGAPCAQGAALTCPTGQIDACSYKPPYASNHICVVVPRPAP